MGQGMVFDTGSVFDFRTDRFGVVYRDPDLQMEVRLQGIGWATRIVKGGNGWTAVTEIVPMVVSGGGVYPADDVPTSKGFVYELEF